MSSQSVKDMAKYWMEYLGGPLPEEPKDIIPKLVAEIERLEADVEYWQDVSKDIYCDN